MSDDPIDPDHPPAPCYLDVEEAEGWAFSVLTAAHHDMDDYLAMSRTPPAGGISSLVSLTLALLEDYGQTLGLSREQLLQKLCLVKDYHSDSSDLPG